MVESTVFGTDVAGDIVHLYRIVNRFGEYVELLDYGASIHSICILNRANALVDVTLGVNSADQLHHNSTEGAIYGRCANRIADGRYCIDGTWYQLEKNLNGHCLHSGNDNYARKIFSAKIGENSVQFSLRDFGNCGYACAVDVQILYSWTDNCALTIDYQMLTDGDTLLSPTNHTYFNLGNKDIRDLSLEIDASHCAVRSERGLPEGNIQPVYGTHWDFTQPIEIGRAMKRAQLISSCDPFEYDDNLVLNGTGFRKAATLVSPANQIGMSVFTDMPAVVLYTPFFRQPRIGKHNVFYEGFSAVCLETQYVSNAINCRVFEKPIFHAGETLCSSTMYKFFLVEM